MENPLKKETAFPPRFMIASHQGKPACLKPVVDVLTKTKTAEVCEVATPNEATLAIQPGWCGVVVLVVSNKADLVPIVNFLVSKEAMIRKSKSLRVLVFNYVDHPKVHSLLMSKGASEVLDPSLSGKTFLYKTTRHLKLVASPTSTEPASTALEKRSLNSQAEDQLQAIRPPMREERHATSRSKPKVKLAPPLTQSADYWLLRKTSDAKHVMGKWLIELVGPGPAVGSWDEGSSGVWEWKVRAASGPFYNRGYRWLFFGRQPEFNWKVNRWRFVGESASLGLYSGQDQASIAQRFVPEEQGTLLISKNSTQAQGLLPLIQESFDKSFEFKAELHKNSGNLHSISRDEELPDWNEGDLSEDLAHSNWNLGELSEDDVPPEWNDQGGSRQNVFNSRHGLAQGPGGVRAENEAELWKTSAEALKQTGISASLDEIPAEILEQGETYVRLEVEMDSAFPGRPAVFKAKTLNLKPSVDFSLSGTIVSVEPSDGSGRTVLEVHFPQSAAAPLRKLTEVMQRRQEEVFIFLKSARGR